MKAIVGFLLLFGLATSGWSTQPTVAEMDAAHNWAVRRFGNGRRAPLEVPPFAFHIGDQESMNVLKSWTTASSLRRLDRKRIERSNTYTDSVSGLVVTCRSVEWRDFPTVEGALNFKNTGKSGTPIIFDIPPIEIQ